jgi:hypothetical protein
MKEQELMIGDWVHHRDNWSYRQPDQDFGEFDFQWSSGDWYALGECTLTLDDIEPIPLTEEWLLKLGIHKIGCDNEGDDLFATKLNTPADEVWLNRIEGDFYLQEYGKKIKYVHQLQNLYFALTNEELTYDN